MKEIENKIIKTLDKLKPYLQNDGGDVEFIKYEDGIVYVKFLGACSHCHMMEYTLKDGIEAALMEEIPEIKEVINIDN
jgi:Fe-S cluster biogenesis protein NfuA